MDVKIETESHTEENISLLSNTPPEEASNEEHISHVRSDESDRISEDNDNSSTEGDISINELSPLTKKLLTATYSANFLALGLGFGTVGPSLAALAFNTQTSFETIGSIFTARGLGWLLGSIVAGKIFEIWNGNRLMFTALLMMTLFTFILPLLSSLWSVFLVSVLQAGFMSWIDVGANSLTMAVWKTESGPYMQFLHFAFGVGATFAPFVIGVFISLFKSSQSALWSYYPLGLITLATGIPLLLLKAPTQTKEPTMELNNDTIDGDDTQIKKENRSKNFKYYITISLISAYLFLYVGAESSYGGWIFTYAVRVYKFDDASAAYLSSAFWGAITFGRLLGVPISVKLSAKTILFVDMAASVVCVAILVIFSSLKNHILLWVMTLGFGLSMASIFATAFSLPASLGMATTPRATSMLVVGGSMGDMVVPMITGWLMGLLGANSLLLIVVGLFAPAMMIYFFVLFGMPFFYKSNLPKGVDQQDFELLNTKERGNSI